MFNSTQDLKNLISPAQLFKNSDELYCPTTSILIKNVGCSVGYPGDVLSINQKNETLAKMNHKGKI